MNLDTMTGALFASTAILGVTALCGLVRYLMVSIGYSKMYKKAGVAGWKAFIPVINTYNNYNISWDSTFFFIYIAMYVLSYALSNVDQMLLSLVGAACGIALIVFAIKQNVKMAKAFGKGAGTGILLIIFPGITALVLGLGKAEYTAIAE